MPIIELKNIEYSYNSTDQLNSFKLFDVNAELYPGEFISIIGPNGAGKSTLLKIISGFYKPQKGNIKLFNKDYSDYDLKTLAKKIGFVAQTNYSIFPFSVYEIVMMGRTPYLGILGFDKKEDREIVEDILETLGIYSIKDKGINEVSGGEIQRAFIARALVQQPEIILLDEPNAHLDIQHQISIFNILNLLKDEKGLTVISISHDLNLAGYYSDRVILMNNGEIILNDKKKYILTEENIYNIFKVHSSINYDETSDTVQVTLLPKQ